MQTNYFNSYQQPQCFPLSNPNAVSINIIAPQAYGSTNGATCPVGNNGFYSLYGQNTNPGLPLYPQNYNNLALQQNNYPNQLASNYAIKQPEQQVVSPSVMPDADSENSKKNLTNQTDLLNNTELVTKTPNDEQIKEKTEEKTKKVVPLTDDYIKSLENYMNNENPKVRLIGAKELLERFKEDENRIDNPSLMPLLNKALRDPSPSVRFLGLTILQLGYAAGNDETVTILKEIQTQNTDKIGEDSLLASEILLNMAQGQKVEVPMTPNEIEKEKQKQSKQGGE